MICKFEMRQAGGCYRGDVCQFSHDSGAMERARASRRSETPGSQKRHRSPSRSLSERDPRGRSKTKTPRTDERRKERERNKSKNRDKSPIGLGKKSRSPSASTSRSQRGRKEKTIELDRSDSSVEEIIPAHKIKQEKVEAGNLKGVTPIPVVKTPQSSSSQVKELPTGPDGIKKIQKSPLYSTAAIKNVLVQEEMTQERMMNFLEVLPRMQEYLQNQVREEKERESKTKSKKERRK